MERWDIMKQYDSLIIQINIFWFIFFFVVEWHNRMKNKSILSQLTKITESKQEIVKTIFNMCCMVYVYRAVSSSISSARFI